MNNYFKSCHSSFKAMIFISGLVLALQLPVKAQWHQMNPLYGAYVSCFLTDSNEVYIGTLGSGIYYSPDFGHHWYSRSKGLTPHGYGIRAIVKLDSVLFAGYSHGLFKSDDYGLNWTFCSPNNQLLLDCYCLLVKDTILFAGTIFGKILRSYDAGNSWEVVYWGNGYFDMESILRFKLIGNKIYACVIGEIGGVLVSNDNGNTWTYQNEGLESRSITDITFYDNTFYAANRWDGVYKSESNQSLNWTLCSNGITEHRMKSIYYCNGNIYAGTFYDDLYRSSNDGETWTEISGGLIEDAVNEITSIHNNEISIGISDLGILNSADNGNTWTPMNTGLSEINIVDIVSFDNKTYCSIKHKGIYVSSDNGSTWNFTSQDIPDINIMDLEVAATTIYAGTYDHGLYKSLNGGLNWSSCNNGILFEVEYIPVIKAFGDTLFVHTGDGGSHSYRSFDNGGSWQSITIPYQPNVTDFEIFNGTLFASTDGDGIYRSFNYGNSWSPVQNEPMHIHELIRSEHEIYAACIGGLYMLDEQDAKNWRNISSGLPIDYVETIEIVQDILIAGLWIEGFYTMNLNQQSEWKYMGTIDMTDFPKPARLTYSNNFLYCTISGFGLWKYNFPLLPESEVTSLTNNSSSILNVVPFKSLNNSSQSSYHEGECTIYSLNGTKIFEGKLNRTENSSCDFQYLKPGIYIVSFVSEGIIHTEKIFIR
jgi:photosystem II stability/assembly factor-like uncharacterized protein